LNGIHEVVEPGGVIMGRFGLIAVGLQVGQCFDQPLLVAVGRMRICGWLVLEVPAFPALRRPQYLGPLGARRADLGQC
jgi:hypothetical protein